MESVLGIAASALETAANGLRTAPIAPTIVANAPPTILGRHTIVVTEQEALDEVRMPEESAQRVTGKARIWVADALATVERPPGRAPVPIIGELRRCAVLTEHRA
jgi:hypothetical protein